MYGPAAFLGSLVRSVRPAAKLLILNASDRPGNSFQDRRRARQGAGLAAPPAASQGRRRGVGIPRLLPALHLHGTSQYVTDPGPKPRVPAQFWAAGGASAITGSGAQGWSALRAASPASAMTERPAGAYRCALAGRRGRRRGSEAPVMPAACGVSVLAFVAVMRAGCRYGLVAAAARTL